MMSMAANEDGGAREVPGVMRRVVGFARLLRDNGYGIGPADVVDAVRVLAPADLLEQHTLRRTLSAVFCRRRSEMARFDELFDAYWLDRARYKRTILRSVPPKELGAEVELGGDGSQGGTPAGLARYFEWANDNASGDPLAEGEGGSSKLGGASTADAAGTVDIGKVGGADDRECLMAWAERLGARMRYRISRRMQASSKGTLVDLRRTLRYSMVPGSAPPALLLKRRRKPPLALVVFVDVSGSMDAYSLFFMRFAHALTGNFVRADTFIFHTRLVHVSGALSEASPVKMMEKLAILSQGWSGGTRIGEAIDTFNRSHSRSICTSRTVALIVSDGYDTGDPACLATALGRLKRHVRKVIWLNPLLGRPSYAPVVPSMAAALAHVDLFAPAHNLESLKRLEDALVSV